MAQIGELVWKITGDNSGANKALKDTDKQVEKTGAGFNKLKIGAFAVGAAIAGTAVALTRMVKNQLNVIDASAKMADKLGITMEAMSGLEHIAGLTGASAEQLGVAVQMLDVRIGQSAEGVGKAESSLRQLGLSMEDVTSLEPDKAFFKVAESLQKVEDRTQQAYIAQELFGRQGRELLGVIRSSGSSLGDLADEAERLGLTISRSSAAEVEKFNDNMFRLSQRAEGAKRQFTVSLMPALNDLGRALLSASENGDFLQNALDGINSLAVSVIESITALISKINVMTGTASEVEKLNESIMRTEDAIRNLNTESAILAEAGIFRDESAEFNKLTSQLEKLKKLREQALKDESSSAPRPTGIRTPSGKSTTEKELTELEKLKKSTQEYNDNLLENRIKKAQQVLTFAQAQGGAEDQAVAKAKLRELEEEKINQVLNRRIGIINQANMAINAGASIIQAFGALVQAQGEADLARLDAKMQAELEAAGVAEETTVEQAQREYDIAVATGSELEKEEKRRALEKAKIEEKFAKERKKIEYETALQSWEIQRVLAVAQGAQAILNAYSSAAAIPVVGFKIAPFAALAAGIASGIQIAAVNAAKPQPPKFAEGGIVPGTSFSGDRVQAQVNSGEMILNQSQQARLFEIANQGGGSGNITVYLGDELIYKSLYNASKRGDLIIDARGVVTR